MKNNNIRKVICYYLRLLLYTPDLKILFFSKTRKGLNTNLLISENQGLKCILTVLKDLVRNV